MPATSSSRSILALTLLGSAVMLMSQTTAISRISGSVKDSTGGAVPNAQVTATGPMSNASRTTLTDANGQFVFESLVPGSYTVKVEIPGFKLFQRAGVSVTADKPADLPIALQVSEASSSVDVSAKIDPFEVVPNTPTPTMFGFDTPLQEIPRSVSVVESSTIERYDIKTVNDLVTVSPGSFTGSYFGVPGSLFIRGEAGDNFFRGFRRVENRGNYETPVAATDHIEIVKGPPSPIYGGGKMGGFLNFIPKSARSTTAKWLEHPTGKITLTYGSYSQKIGAIEFGSPFKIDGYRGGFYSYFQVQDSKSFYHGISTRDKLGQIAFDQELPKKFRIEAGFQGFFGSLPQNIGWNRVTQNLIDHNEYLAGAPKVNLATNGYNLGPANLTPGQLLYFADKSNLAADFHSPANAATAAQFALDPSTVHLTQLSNQQILVDTPDFSDALTFTGYFDIVRDFKEGLSIKNQSFYDSLNHSKYSTYGFSALYTPHVLENKTSLDYSFSPSKWFKVATTSGFSYRATEVAAGESRTLYQVIDRTDLSTGPTPNTRFQGAFNSGGQWGFNYFQQGNYGDTGLFALTNVSIANKLTVLAGVRWDYFTPNFLGQDNGEGLTRAKDSTGATTFNTSVSYRLPFHIIPYITYASSNYLDLGQGGEIDYSEIRNRTYVQPSKLYEAGVKTSAFGNKLFASLSVFRQRRSATSAAVGLTSGGGSLIDYFRTTGVEMEVRAALSRRFSLTGAFTWQKPEQLNIPFLLGIPPTSLGLTDQEAYGGRFIGDAGIFGIKAPVKVAGQPPVVASVFGTYSPTRNFGFTLGTTYVDKVMAGYITNVRLPAYSMWRGSAYYERGKYSATLAVNNVFDKHYFTSQFLFWDVFVKPSELRTLSLTTSYRF